MTKYEIDVLDKLRENPYFECLSVEALLYEAIRGTDIEEVQTVLDMMWEERSKERAQSACKKLLAKRQMVANE